MRPFFIYLKPVYDFAVTLLHWIYLVFGFAAFFSPFYLGALLLSANREVAFQKLNHIFFKSFFLLSRLLIPKLVLNISDQVRSMRSCVIVCNHLSYFDPLLFVSLFEKQKTIVKSTFFKVPVFGSILKTSGYIPSTSVGAFSSLMIERVGKMGDFLSSGGNLFVFPEGTRSKDGSIGKLNEGAFKIARRFRVPLKVCLIKNTNALYRPKNILLDTGIKKPIEIKLIGGIEPDCDGHRHSVSDLMSRTRLLFEKGTF
jgi:1-acyl-sn-glycerol-3-phosphate acyltransferase